VDAKLAVHQQANGDTNPAGPPLSLCTNQKKAGLRTYPKSLNRPGVRCGHR
jgi:hypothetical protein